jgi:hypothetical protein
MSEIIPPVHPVKNQRAAKAHSDRRIETGRQHCA